MDDNLRNMLWELVDSNLAVSDYHRSNIYKLIWVGFFRRPSDTCPLSDQKSKKSLRDWVFACEWYELFNFLEYLYRYVKFNIDTLNYILEQELSAYRFIDSKFIPITDEVEIRAIESALSGGAPEGARAHLKAALAHFARRPHPDLRNSVKEAISAVESAARIASGKDKATLGDALKAIDPSSNLHPAFKEAMNKLYGYASDEDGIRHSLLVSSAKVTSDDAQFMLVVCSAFVSYITARQSHLSRHAG